MAALTTGDLTIPTQMLDPWLGKVSSGSVIATLADSQPMKFGKGEAFTFDIGEAELVGEGQNKGPSTVSSSVQTVEPFKFHKTVRWTEEVKWADEDHQMGVVQQILDLIQPALSRALDFGVIHGINPADGSSASAITQKLMDATNVVESTGSESPYQLLDSADEAVLANSYLPRDVALDPSFASKFSTLRNSDGIKLYPDLSLATQPTGTLDNHRSSVSRTVSADGVASTASNLLGVVGDFGSVRWGIQKQIGLEMIEYGDPDGGGDLKRNNQVAFRAEVVYGWGIADLDAFARIGNFTADDGGGASGE